MTEELENTPNMQPGALNPENAPTIEPDPVALVLRGDNSLRDHLLSVIVHNLNALHMTFSELAADSGIDADLLRRIFEGDAALTTEDAERLAHAVGSSFVASCDEAEALPPQQDDTPQQAEGLTPEQLRVIHRLKYSALSDETDYRRTMRDLIAAVYLTMDPKARILEKVWAE